MERICAECERPFESRRADTRTCSKKCWRAVYKREQNQPSKKRQAKAQASGQEVVRRRRSGAELVETDRKAVQMHFLGADVGVIQRALGFDTWGAAQASLQRGMRMYRAMQDDTDPGDLRAFETARVDWEIKQLIPAISRTIPLVSTTGKVVIDPATGEPIPDYDLKIKAVLAYDKIADRGARLKGVYPEKDANINIVPVTHIVQGVDVGALR